MLDNAKKRSGAIPTTADGELSDVAFGFALGRGDKTFDPNEALCGRLIWVNGNRP
jgi:hypothetical protein